MSRFLAAVAAPEELQPDAYCFVVAEKGLVTHDDEGATLPTLDELPAIGLSIADARYLGRLDDRDALAFASSSALPEGWIVRPLRSLYAPLGEALWGVAGRATQIVNFEQTHRFCGRCATPTVAVEGERSRRCPNCGLSFYPRLSPAIIVLVRRGEEALLARHARLPAKLYTTLAGFVEAGESLEDAVHRELREEAGIEVTNLTYFGSEPWPFPHSLMVGFFADYAGGEVVPDGVEVVDVRWFSRDALPDVPPRMSISRRLIDAWVDGSAPPFRAD